MLTVQMKERQISFSTLLPDNMPEIMADYLQIKRVFINLINNAIKYTPDGGKITVRANIINNGNSGRYNRHGVAVCQTKRSINYLRSSIAWIQLSTRRLKALALAWLWLNTSLRRIKEKSGLKVSWELARLLAFFCQ